MSDRLADEDLDRLVELAAAATPRPWVCCRSGPEEASVHHIEVDLCVAAARMAENAEGYVPLRRRDAEYIAAAGNLAPALAAEVRRLRADYPGGDQEGQAVAWSAVYRLCEELGMLSRYSEDWTGRGRVLSFVQHLYDKAERLRVECERLRTELFRVLPSAD